MYTVQYMPRPCDLDLLTLKVVSESHVMWATSVPFFVFLGLILILILTAFLVHPLQEGHYK